MTPKVGPYFDRDGSPICLRRWGELQEDWEYKRVAFDEVGNQQVSTVWLGLNHSTSPSGTPVAIFETMVFPECELWRYSTLDQARAGHEAVCAELRVAQSSNVEVPE